MGMVSRIVSALGPGGRFVHAGADEGQQFFFGGGGAGNERGEDHGQFAGVGVGRADGGAELHGGVGGQGVFDDLGVDVVAAADDEVFGAAAQVQALLVVDEAQVAGGEPAVGREGFGVVGSHPESRRTGWGF